MPGFEHGSQRALRMVIETAVLAILIGKIVPALVDTGYLPRGLFWWIIPVSIITAIITVDKSRYWSFSYLAGVCIGIFIALPIFLKAGLLGPLDLLIFGGVAASTIGLRVKIHSSRF